MTVTGGGMIAATDGMGRGIATTTGANVAGASCVTMMTIVQAATLISSCAVGTRSFASSVATESQLKPA